MRIGDTAGRAGIAPGVLTVGHLEGMTVRRICANLADPEPCTLKRHHTLPFMLPPRRNENGDRCSHQRRAGETLGIRAELMACIALTIGVRSQAI